MPVISTFAALSARGFGYAGGSPIYGGTGYISYQGNTIVDATIDSSGNYIALLCNASLLPTGSTVTSFIMATTYSGVLIFYKSINFLGSFQGICITTDAANNIIVGGAINSTGYIAKFTTTGTFSWGRFYTSGTLVSSITVDSSLNVYAGLNQTNTAIAGVIKKHDSSGTNLATLTLNGISGGSPVSPKKVIIDSSGKFFITYGPGVSIGAPTGFRRLATGIGCLNSDGTNVYNYNPNNGGTRYSTFIEDFALESSTGNVYLLQRSINSVSFPTVNAVIVTVTKLDTTGAVIWSQEKSIPATSNVLITGSINLNSNGDVFIAFALTNVNQTYIVKLTSTGATVAYNDMDINISTIYTPPNALDWYDGQIVLSGGGDIENLPDTGKIPVTGTYINSGRTYTYAPTYAPGFTSTTVPTTTDTLTTSSGAGSGTAVTFTATDVANTYTKVNIGV
jgi:hypothetical protein